MAFELVDAEIFREGDWQEIVDEEGRANIPAMFQPFERRRHPERKLADVYVDATRR